MKTEDNNPAVSAERIKEMIIYLKTDILDAYANELLAEKQDFQYDKEKHPFMIDLTKEEAQFVVDCLTLALTPKDGDGELKDALARNEKLVEALKPFTKLAHEVILNGRLTENQIVYAYNKAEITMQDLRNALSANEKEQEGKG